MTRKRNSRFTVMKGDNTRSQEEKYRLAMEAQAPHKGFGGDVTTTEVEEQFIESNNMVDEGASNG